MQSISSQMFSSTSLATNNTYGVVKGDTSNFPIQNGLLSVPEATNTVTGGIKLSEKYEIDANGYLKERDYVLLDCFDPSFSILTEEPEYWYKGETYVEKNLFEEGFIPTTETFYKHIGVTSNIYHKNGIYYFDGTRYYGYYTKKENTDIGDIDLYDVVTEQKTFESGKYYSFAGVTPLFEEPSDWSTKYTNYWYYNTWKNVPTESDWDWFNKLTSKPASFIPNKYYLQPTEIVMNNTKEPDGRDCKFLMLKIEFYNCCFPTTRSVYRQIYGHIDEYGTTIKSSIHKYRQTFIMKAEPFVNPEFPIRCYYFTNCTSYSYSSELSLFSYPSELEYIDRIHISGMMPCDRIYISAIRKN